MGAEERKDRTKEGPKRRNDRAKMDKKKAWRAEKNKPTTRSQKDRAVTISEPNTVELVIVQSTN